MTDPVVARTLRDLNRPAPAIHLTGWRTHVRAPRPGPVIPGLALVGTVVALVAEAGDGWRSTARWLVVEVPLGVVWGVLAVWALVTLVQRLRNPRPSWYRWWSMLDQREEAGGVRLLSNRARADDPGVLVRRGDTVEIGASLASRGLHGERSYDVTVSAPDGRLTFTFEGWIEKLSRASLDAQAERWGFTVVTHGDADRLRRD